MVSNRNDDTYLTIKNPNFDKIKNKIRETETKQKVKELTALSKIWEKRYSVKLEMPAVLLPSAETVTQNRTADARKAEDDYKGGRRRWKFDCIQRRAVGVDQRRGPFKFQKIPTKKVRRRSCVEWEKTRFILGSKNCIFDLFIF